MNLSKVSHLPLAACLAALITVGMPALSRLHPPPADDPWLRIRPALYPVAGRLLYEGRPVTGAMVSFVSGQDAAGRQYQAFSTTDREGRFWLRTFSSQGHGAVAGRHRIRVEQMVPTGRMLVGPGMESQLELGAVPRWAEAAIDRGVDADGRNDERVKSFPLFPGQPEMVNILPARFADETTSGLAAEVTAAGPNEFLIRLSAEPPAAVAD